MPRPFCTAIVALVASFLLHAPAVAADTSWMLEAKYGVFMHYQHRILLGYSHGAAALGTKAKLPPLSEMTAEGWSRFVDGFDAQGFADQMAEGQLGWVLFCIDDHYFGWPCAPNKPFDKYTGYAPGEKCSRRDLELIDWINTCNRQGGVCTLDWPIDPQTGLLKNFGMAQLQRIAQAVKASPPSP